MPGVSSTAEMVSSSTLEQYAGAVRAVPPVRGLSGSESGAPHVPIPHRATPYEPLIPSAEDI